MNQLSFTTALQGQRYSQFQKIIACNSLTAQYGLRLSPEDTELLLLSREQALKDQNRIELSEGILPRLIETFCDSPYIHQDTYAQTLADLQELFYIYKNESLDLLTDDELLAFMREQFDGICCGDTDYLGGTCLDRFAQAARAGYDGYQATGGKGMYEQFSQEQHWDHQLFLEVLRELIQ
ncbi:DUF6323 family protein [Anaerovorax odorimutans]|uniref:DUF6323 family protein n=1 Tax=Anaerovorax odorimutans TaxID=109327 RepID=A0ABT1RJM7_9FIRM|nr:DUF6323 family protein [Anaerovorax odorimutans]MCQ4635370.1 DUF6323 family protein [Anaerovorax odorimutans]